jgi:transposase-like protein
MPWKASSVMEEKLRFIFEHDLGEQTMQELCRQYGIARETGYVWLRRYRAYGLAGLPEHSRAAHRHHNQTPEEIEQPPLFSAHWTPHEASFRLRLREFCALCGLCLPILGFNFQLLTFNYRPPHQSRMIRFSQEVPVWA